VKKFVEESWLILLLGVVFALMLAGAQTTLSARIRENQQRALNEAIGEVVPHVSRTEVIEIEGYQVFKCHDEQGQLSGWAVRASGSGFVDKITLVVGLSPDGERVTGLKVIENVETPGLGNKIEGEWASQYEGLSFAKAIQVEKGPPDPARNQIQAITGATWSSRYVTDIVNEVANRVRPKLAEHR